MRPVLPALLVLLGVALAGCTGGSNEGEGVAAGAARLLDSGPTAEELARMPGSIQGVVTTPALEPIAGAQVRLVRENVTRTTDASGFFRFAALPTTSYLVEASAEGYLTRTVQASARNGTVVEINLTLEPAVVHAPHAETREFAGLLSCGAHVATPEGARGAECAAADPNHRAIFEFDVMPDGKNVVLELAWSPDENPGLQRLRLHVETVGYGAMDEDLGAVVGEGYARLVVPQAIMEKYYPEGGRLRASVGVAPEENTPPVSVALQSRFALYVTAFYVEPGPEDHSVVTPS